MMMSLVAHKSKVMAMRKVDIESQSDKQNNDRNDCFRLIVFD